MQREVAHGFQNRSPRGKKKKPLWKVTLTFGCSRKESDPVLGKTASGNQER